MNPTDSDLESLAASIERGDDGLKVPADLIVEPGEGTVADKSIQTRLAGLKVGERIKLALLGNREVRQLLVRETNRLVARMVLRNPRLTDDEVVAMARNPNLDSDILRQIGENKQWARNYAVRAALVTNAKTPLPTALPFVRQLNERDLRLLARSKNVPSAVSVQARRMLTQMGKL